LRAGEIGCSPPPGPHQRSKSPTLVSFSLSAGGPLRPGRVRHVGSSVHWRPCITRPPDLHVYIIRGEAALDAVCDITTPAAPLRLAACSRAPTPRAPGSAAVSATSVSALLPAEFACTANGVRSSSCTGGDTDPALHICLPAVMRVPVIVWPRRRCQPCTPFLPSLIPSPSRLLARSLPLATNSQSAL